jgi:hypothetical protein
MTMTTTFETIDPARVADVRGGEGGLRDLIRSGDFSSFSGMGRAMTRGLGPSLVGGTLGGAAVGTVLPGVGTLSGAITGGLVGASVGLARTAWYGPKTD